MTRVRIVAVGSNFITDWFVEAARKSPLLEVVGILSRTMERAEEYRAKMGLSHAFCDSDAVLGDPTVDALYIATPNYAHFELARRALLAGKHVLVEKCITETLSDFLTLRNIAREGGLVLLEAMRPDFDAAIDALRDALPLVGSLRRASLEYCQYSSRYDTFLSGTVLNAFDPTIGNCALADIGIYPLHIAISLFGAPTAQHSHSTFLPNGFEGMGEISLLYPERGFFATVTYSKITDGVRPSVIEGEEGTLTVDHISRPTRVTFLPRRGEERVLYHDASFSNMAAEAHAFGEMVLGRRSAEPYLDRTEATLAAYDRVIAESGIFPR